jgi:YhcH/YjgK/YiaL family protein
MIFDSLENAEIYYGLGEKFQKAFEFLKTTDLENLPLEKIQIDGDDIFAIPQKYSTKEESEGKWEAHRKYIDIQYLVSGSENIGFVLIDYLEELEPYDDEKDVEFFSGEGDYVQVHDGEFAVFFPDDAHKPGLKIESTEEVFKIVFKIKV